MIAIWIWEEGVNAGNEKLLRAKGEKKLCIDKVAQKGNKCLLKSSLSLHTTPG